MKGDSKADVLIGTLVFALLVAAFLYDRIVGWRVLGLAEIGWAVWVIVQRRVSYGIEGRPPAGYLVGASAIAVGVVGVAIGLLFVFAPHAIDGLFHRAP